MDVKGPVAALAVLAVADDIDAGVGLVLDDLLDRLPEAGFVGGLVVGLAILDLAQKLDQFGWPNQAADMGREDAVAGHFSPLNFLFVTRALPYHLRTVPAAIAAGVERNDIRSERAPHSPWAAREL